MLPLWMMAHFTTRRSLSRFASGHQPRRNVQRGDTIRLRYGFGMDGWYVDDVMVSACNVRKGN